MALIAIIKTLTFSLDLQAEEGKEFGQIGRNSELDTLSPCVEALAPGPDAAFFGDLADQLLANLLSLPEPHAYFPLRGAFLLADFRHTLDVLV